MSQKKGKVFAFLSGCAVGAGSLFYLISLGYDSVLKQKLYCNYLTVDEFSKMAKIPKHKVYALTKTSLAPYVKIIDGVKHINKEALQVI